MTKQVTRRAQTHQQYLRQVFDEWGGGELDDKESEFPDLLSQADHESLGGNDNDTELQSTYETDTTEHHHVEHKPVTKAEPIKEDVEGEAATKIQKVVKAKAARARVKKVLEKVKAPEVAQAAVAKAIAMATKKHADNLKVEKEAAETIQKAVKGKAARKVVAEMKAAVEAEAAAKAAADAKTETERKLAAKAAAKAAKAAKAAEAEAQQEAAKVAAEAKAKEDEAARDQARTSATAAAANRVRNAETWFDILGVAETATKADIKRAFRKVSLELHPDKAEQNGLSAEDANALFKKVSGAHDIATGKEPPAPAAPSPATAPNAPPAESRRAYSSAREPQGESSQPEPREPDAPAAPEPFPQRSSAPEKPKTKAEEDAEAKIRETWEKYVREEEEERLRFEAARQQREAAARKRMEEEQQAARAREDDRQRAEEHEAWMAAQNQAAAENERLRREAEAYVAEPVAPATKATHKPPKERKPAKAKEVRVAETPAKLKPNTTQNLEEVNTLLREEALKHVAEQERLRNLKEHKEAQIKRKEIKNKNPKGLKKATWFHRDPVTGKFLPRK